LSTETIDKSQKSMAKMPIWLLLTIGLVLVVGLVCGLLLNNFLDSKQITFGTESLISFVFTIALGAAAIILAVITIVLSRFSEDALIRRSDEGIRIQTDVFAKTTEVLSRIQASTGVTEKRLEDIIAGRTTVIAQEAISKNLPGSQSGMNKAQIDKLRDDLADSLKAELLPLLSKSPSDVETALAALETKQKSFAEATSRWQEYRTSVLSAIKADSSLVVISECEGDIDEGDNAAEFWDVMLKSHEQLIGLDIQIADQIPVVSNLRAKAGQVNFLKTISWHMTRSDMHFAFVVFETNVWDESPMCEMKTMIEDFNSHSETSKIYPIFGAANAIPGLIKEKIGHPTVQ